MYLGKNTFNFIYVLTKNDHPFYVGKTHNVKTRLRDHKVNHGSNIEMRILEAVKIDEPWLELEKKWIRNFREWGVELKNGNGGGGGVKTGYKRSPEFGEKISKSKKGKKRDSKEVIPATIARQKPVLQFDKQGNFIKEYPSAKHAAKEIDIHYNTFYDHLKGKYKTSRGFIFKYKN